jgi:tRNA 2-thiouridine synthesizing protein A
MMQYDIILDTSGMICPYPIVKTKQAMALMQTGQVIKVICTDPSSVIDFESFVVVAKHTMLERETPPGQYIFVIRKEESDV